MTNIFKMTLCAILISLPVYSSSYNFFHVTGEEIALPEQIVAYLLSILAMFVVGFFYKKSLVGLSDVDLVIPDSKVSVRSITESIGSYVVGLTRDVLGHEDYKRFTPFAVSVFLLIVGCNLIGLIPGFGAATSNINTTLALGVYSFLYYNIAGVKSVGIVNHLKHLAGPSIWLAPLIFAIEIISHCIRPLSLSLRLRYNIEVDHMVLSIFTDLTKLVVPVVFYVMGTFVCFLQGVVYTTLSLIYIKLSLGEHDHDH
jgi:F-type H+-transporting ATPase subunit a